jgi:hypothetical protein
MQPFGGELEGRRPLRKSERRLEDNIKINLQEIGWPTAVALLNMAMKLRVS